LESAGVEFIDENGGGPGGRLRKRQHKRGIGILRRRITKRTQFDRQAGAIEQSSSSTRTVAAEGYAYENGSRKRDKPPRKNQQGLPPKGQAFPLGSNS